MKTKDELAAEQAAYWNGPGGNGWLAAYERIQRSLTSPQLVESLASLSAMPHGVALNATH